MLAVSYLDRGPSLQVGGGWWGVLFSGRVFAGVIICAGTSVAHAALSRQHPAHLRVAAF